MFLINVCRPNIPSGILSLLLEESKKYMQWEFAGYDSFHLFLSDKDIISFSFLMSILVDIDF